MTDEMMSLRAFVEKAPDADVLREMIIFADERARKTEVGRKGLAASGKRNGVADVRSCMASC